MSCVLIGSDPVRWCWGSKTHEITMKSWKKMLLSALIKTDLKPWGLFIYCLISPMIRILITSMTRACHLIWTFAVRVPESSFLWTHSILLKHPMVSLSQSPVNQAVLENFFILRRYYHKYFKLTRVKVRKITIFWENFKTIHQRGINCINRIIKAGKDLSEHQVQPLTCHC